MFEIKEVSQVEVTGSLWGAAISCIGTWGAAGLLYTATVIEEVKVMFGMRCRGRPEKRKPQ
jgi:hypothetical protein